MSDTLDPPVQDPARRAPAVPDAPADGGGSSWWWVGLRPLVLRLHFYVGVFVGPFLLLAATTGLLYTVTPQLEQLVHSDALTVSVGGAQLPLRDQVAAAAAAVPDGTVTLVRPPIAEDSTTRVTFDAPGTAADYDRTAFVDPYTGRVTAVLDTFGEWLPVRAWLDDLHRTLHLGDVGRVYSELAASWLWVLAASGLAIWVVRRRRRSRVRRTLLPERSARGRARVRSWHGSVGVWLAVGMLFLSATGLTWSQFAGENVTELRSALDWSTPSVSEQLPSGSARAPVVTDPATLGATADRVLAGARSAGLRQWVEITPAAQAGQAWTVTEGKRSWPEQQDSVAVDPSTGAVRDVVRFDDWPPAAKLARWGVDAHMGILFGWVNQVVLIALALGIIAMVVWGYRMWWLRRPTRAGATAPGGTRRPGPGAVAVVGVVAIGLGIVVPLLGASLLAFLVGDVLAQEWRRHRSPGDRTATPA